MAILKGRVPKLGSLTADVWVEERHRREMEVTQNPVEYGSPITDHAFIRARKLAVMFKVSNTPINSSGSFGGTDRVADARKKLFMLQDKKEFLDVFTVTGGEYKNCLLTGIGWSTDSNNPDAVIFELDLEEIIVTSTKKTSYEPQPADERINAKTSENKDSGNTQKNDRDAANAKRQEAIDAEEKAKNIAVALESKKISESNNKTLLKQAVEKIDDLRNTKN